jgi:hypothetical protein
MTPSSVGSTLPSFTAPPVQHVSFAVMFDPVPLLSGAHGVGLDRDAAEQVSRRAGRSDGDQLARAVQR